LSDEPKRTLYNQYGHAGVDPNFQQNPFGGGGAGGGGGFDFGDGSIHFSQGNGEELEDIFEAFFGGGGGGGNRRRPRGPRRGADLQMQVEISFEEAVFGVQKELDIRYQMADAKSNQIKTKERSVKVDIPAGMESGMNLRLKNQGAEGDPGAPNGNLLVQVIVKESDYYAREGADVHTEMPISISQAVLGGSMDVKTLTGTVELKIPPGSQPGARLMIRNRGIPRLNSPGNKGHHYVHIKVRIPKTITARQEALLREFDAAGTETLIGRVAHAAESAFEKVFGSNKDQTKKNDSSTATAAEEDSSDDNEEPKKQAAAQ
jgi:molecular chaperone DnaJ